MANKTIIIGSGSYIPTNIVPNSAFLTKEFYEANGNRFPQSNAEIIRKFEEITEIRSRRYVDDDLVASDMAYLAAKNALEHTQVYPENLDYIIVAHNFGDIALDNKRSSLVPSLASRVKHKLGIKNPKCIAYDLLFGCPGWLQGMIQAEGFLQNVDVGFALIIGAETLSRVCDPHDRDSMIYADGAGATIVCSIKINDSVGLISHAMRSDTADYAHLLWMGPSYNPNYTGNELFLKMNGNALYKYALRYVPQLVKEALDKAGLHFNDVSKLLIHQANAKMDYAILEGVCKLYGIKDIPWDIMPMSIHELGNSSVATIPTLLDFILKGKVEGHGFKSGDILVFASVGAGMNINVMVYRMPYSKGVN